MDAASPCRHVLARGSSCVSAVPIEHVVEVMRALPVRPIQGAPDFVAGVSIIRGAAVPVVDLERVLGGAASQPISHYVTVRGAAGAVALGVAGLVGVRDVPSATLDQLPPLLRDATAPVARIGSLDGELLVVLQASRLVPDDIWAAMASEG